MSFWQCEEGNGPRTMYSWRWVIVVNGEEVGVVYGGKFFDEMEECCKDAMDHKPGAAADDERKTRKDRMVYLYLDEYQMTAVIRKLKFTWDKTIHYRNATWHQTKKNLNSPTQNTSSTEHFYQFF